MIFLFTISVTHAGGAANTSNFHFSCGDIYSSRVLQERLMAASHQGLHPSPGAPDTLHGPLMYQPLHGPPGATPMYKFQVAVINHMVRGLKTTIARPSLLLLVGISARRPLVVCCAQFWRETDRSWNNLQTPHQAAS